MLIKMLSNTKEFPGNWLKTMVSGNYNLMKVNVRHWKKALKNVLKVPKKTPVVESF